jgi:hypothetical protein
MEAFGYGVGELRHLRDPIAPDNQPTLERAVERPPGCVPRGSWLGTTRRNGRSIPTSCNDARDRAGRAMEVVAVLTQRVTSTDGENPRQIGHLLFAQSGQPLFLGHRVGNLPGKDQLSTATPVHEQ